MRQKAGVIIYVLLTLPVLLTLAALVVNLGLMNNVVEQAKSYTRLLSLTALEQYYEVLNKTDSLQTLNQKVKDRVNTIAKQNKFSGYRDKEFLNFYSNCDSNPTDVGGVLTAGNYYFTDPDPTSSNEVCSDGYPCFRAIDCSESDPNVLSSVNSFKVEGKYLEPLSMRLFGKFLGDPTKAIQTCAISTSVKRDVMFIVDISGSSVSDTFQRRRPSEQIADPEKGRGSFFAYPVSYVQSAPGNFDRSKCSDIDLPYLNKIYCDWDFIRNYNPNSVVTPGDSYDGTPQRRSENGVPDNNTLKHYYEDFIPTNAVADQANYEYPVIGPSGASLAFHPPASSADPDVRAFPSHDLIGSKFYVDSVAIAEPLESIFLALNSGIDTLKKRNVPGDQAGFIFQESNLIWSRMVNLTDNFNYLDFVSKDQQVRMDYGLFPSGLSTEGNTDLYIALKEATTQLIENKKGLNGAPSIDGVVYIGDFIPNCAAEKYFNTAGCGASCSGGGPGCLSTAQCDARNCSDDFTHYKQAIHEIWDYVTAEMIPNKITLNVILLGANAGPHTLDNKHPTLNRCMTTDEIRKADGNLVWGGDESGSYPANQDLWYANRSAESPFYLASQDAFNLAKTTGGIFMPVLGRPANCTPSPIENCNHYVRRKVDRECRNAYEQLEDYVTQIIGSGNPFKLAHTGCNSVYGDGY